MLRSDDKAVRAKDPLLDAHAIVRGPRKLPPDWSRLTRGPGCCRLTSLPAWVRSNPASPDCSAVSRPSTKRLLRRPAACDTLQPPGLRRRMIPEYESRAACCIIAYRRRAATAGEGIYRRPGGLDSWGPRCAAKKSQGDPFGPSIRQMGATRRSHKAHREDRRAARRSRSHGSKRRRQCAENRGLG
jgi:hypothetical protein